MKFTMSTSVRKQQQIRKRVIGFNSINMVNMFFVFKRTTYVLFHNKAMLVSPVLFSNRNSNVSMFVNVLSTLPGRIVRKFHSLVPFLEQTLSMVFIQTIAFLRTKLSLRKSSHSFMGLNLKRLSTMFTNFHLFILTAVQYGVKPWSAARKLGIR